MAVLREHVNADGHLAVKQLGINNYLKENEILALMNNATVSLPEVQAAIERCQQSRAAAETLLTIKNQGQVVKKSYVKGMSITNRS